MDQNLINILAAGGLAVIPTDTLYGVVTPALNREAVERLRQIRQKADDKPLIILISKLSDLGRFGVTLTPSEEQKLSLWWPGPVSVILPCIDPSFRYLYRGSNSLAFRLPKPSPLQALLATTGPLVAPSANLPDLPPATTIDEAKQYFGNQIELYVDGGKIESPASTLVQLGPDGETKVLRGILKT